MIVPLKISESEQCSLRTGYWPPLEVSAANYLSFLSGGGDTDKTLPPFCPPFLSYRELFKENDL